MGAMCAEAKGRMRLRSRQDYINLAIKILAQNDYDRIISSMQTFRRDLYPGLRHIISKKNYREIPPFVTAAIDATNEAKSATAKGVAQSTIDRQIKTKIFTAFMEILNRLVKYLGKKFLIFW